MKKKHCIFCNFKDKETIIHEDKLCFAIISKNPINKYHVLVIPKNHYEKFTDLTDNLAARIFIVAKKLSLAVKKTCRPDAISHLSDDDLSKAGYNLVSHYKFHIIPRFTNDRVKIVWARKADPGLKTRSRYAGLVRKFY